MKNALEKYRQKRNFSITPEPESSATQGSDTLHFVIQKHWARRLHYDFRLELDGVMKSWAVPKGPSLDPKDKRMAVQVEDHPLSYREFEGDIPRGQYGAGRVIIWDRGRWLPIGDAVAGYRAGKLKFELLGHKLRGHWTLVRMHGREDETQAPWLLIKERDGAARTAREFDVVEEMPNSVSLLTTSPSQPQPQLTKARQAAHPPSKTRVRTSQASRVDLPETLAPQLATLADHLPYGEGSWIVEAKWDGYRVLARIASGKAKLFTRNGHDWTAKMPDLSNALARLPLKSGWLDGEVLALNRRNLPDFQALQNAFETNSTAHLFYYAFDLPFADGRDLRQSPLMQRRELLQKLIEQGSCDKVRFSEAFQAEPDDLLAAACKLGFEGVMAKRADSVYVSRRNNDWIKLKCKQRQEFVIGGYTDPQGSRTDIGSLLLGVHDEAGSLRYVGNVGAGFSEQVLATLRPRLSKLAWSESPFAKDSVIARNVHWVQPRMVAEVSFAAWTHAGKIRHAVFHGLRADKPAKAVIRETPVTADPATSADKEQGMDLKISHPERVIDPSTGTTKLDLVRYYAKIGALIMPHLKGRPVSLVRAPDGVSGALFFQKHMETGRMNGIEMLPVGLKALLEVAKPQGLVSAAQMNTVEFHTWNARKDKLARPDRMTFDLDPGEGTSWAHVQEAAALIHLMLKELGLVAFLKTSGGKGLHVVVPIKRLHDWDTVKGFSQSIVQHLATTIPQRFVAKSGPKNRVGKIFVDYLRNGFGATTVSAWSARARPGMGISVPVSWTELDELSSGAHWHMGNIKARLKVGNTCWLNFEKSAKSLTAAMKAL